MNVITRGIRNAFRNIVRALSIGLILGLSIGLSLVMLISYQAVKSKVNQVESVVNNTIDIEPAGFDPTSSANNMLKASQLDAVKHLAHITKLTETFTARLKTIGSSITGPVEDNAQTSLKSPITLTEKDNGGAKSYSGNGTLIVRPNNDPLPADYSQPVPIVGTTDASNPTSVSATSLKITAGKAIDGTKGSNQAMVGSGLATKNNLKVGSTFTAYGQTFTVAGIFDAGTESANSFIVVPLSTIQRLSGHSGQVLSAFAVTDSLKNLTSATAAIKKVLGSSADVSSFADKANLALEPLASVERISLYGFMGAVAAGAVIILLTMIMIVRERKREIGVIKAIGFSNLRIMAQFMAEAMTFTLLGAIVGLAIGILGGSPITAALITNSGGSGNTPSLAGFGGGNFVPHGITQSVQNTQADIGIGIVVFGLAAALLIAMIGSALASFFIARIRPAEVLRSE